MRGGFKHFLVIRESSFILWIPCDRGIQTFASDWGEFFHSLYSLLRIELLMIIFKKKKRK